MLSFASVFVKFMGCVKHPLAIIMMNVKKEWRDVYDTLSGRTIDTKCKIYTQ